MKGIYCYIDKKTDRVVYVGQDGNIHRNKRHNDHTEKWSYNKQQINRILQNNSDRYSYNVLAKGNFTDKELNDLESSFIAMYNTFEDPTKFNYTVGGDCMRGKTHPSYKSEMTVNSNGRVGYNIRYQMKKVCYNNDRAFLQNLVDEFNKGNLTIDEIKKLNKENTTPKKHKITKRDAIKHSIKSNKSGYYRVHKKGKGYCYTYTINNTKKTIHSKTINGLREKVISNGLEWIKFNKEALTWLVTTLDW